MKLIKNYFRRNFLLNCDKYKDEVVGIKISGKCLDDMEIRRNIVKQILELRTLGTRVVLIHGGGNQITREAEAAGIKKDEREGLRYTTKPELEIMERCIPDLTKQLVKDFVEVAQEMGLKKATAIGMNGYDGNMITAELHSPLFEGSRTGKVVRVNKKAIGALMDDHIVVMNSICAGEDGGRWNVNADDVIAALAKELKAKLVIMCSDTPLLNKNGQTIRTLFTDAVTRLYKNGTFNDKIRPKVEAGLNIAEGGCPVAIVDGADPTAIDRELYTKKGGGTRMQLRYDMAA